MTLPAQKHPKRGSDRRPKIDFFHEAITSKTAKLQRDMTAETLLFLFCTKLATPDWVKTNKTTKFFASKTMLKMAQKQKNGKAAWLSASATPQKPNKVEEILKQANPLHRLLPRTVFNGSWNGKVRNYNPQKAQKVFWTTLKKGQSFTALPNDGFTCRANLPLTRR